MAKILIAEDEKSISSFLAFVLHDLGHEVYVSPNGEHALEALQNNHGFDLLICDIKMPKMNGRELIETVQRQEDFLDISIIIMSGYVTPAEIEDLLKAGAEGFLTKPINLTELKRVVNDALKSRLQPEIRALETSRH